MDNLKEEVMELLNFIRTKMKEMNLDAEDVFLNGNCGDLYKIFVSKFSKYTTPFLIRYKDEPYHIVTRIQDKIYDITGETDLEKYIEYIKRENKNYNFDEKAFTIEQLSVADNLLHKMCGMYKYDENYGQSRISNEMGRLLTAIKGFNRDKNEP